MAALVFGSSYANSLILPHLEHCPFCGCENQDALWRPTRVGNDGLYRVRCGMCSATGPGYTKPEMAIQQWNRREPPGPGYVVP